MDINIFILCAFIVVLVIMIFIQASIAKDLAEKLKKVNAEYDALEKKYETIRYYCIKKDKPVPYGKYFVLGWLNMMQNIQSEKWYYISDIEQSIIGCDVDGDIINITDGGTSK